MDVSLTPKMNEWITEKMSTGFYGSPQEVIYEGLRLLKKQDDQRRAMVDDLRSELKVGLRQLDSGHSVVLNDARLAEIKKEGRQRRGR